MNFKRFLIVSCVILQRLMLLALLVCAVPDAMAVSSEAPPLFAIRNASTILINKVYYLNANIDYRFSAAALDALDNGVPLVVELTIEIEREREYVWDETVTSLRQRYQLSYEALTRRYVVTNLNSGADTYYPDRAAAIAAMGEIVKIPILDADLLSPDEKYTVRLQTSLYLEALPVPMRVVGYFSSDWRISSEWFQWPLQ